jgi:uncharacterized phage protein (TIGR01671 family)
MRDIKFRAWDVLDKKMMGPWDWDDILRGRMTIHPSGDACPVMQYTGLKDANGVEIYEGDVLRVWWNREEEWTHFTDHQVVYEIEVNYPAFDLRPPIDCGYNGLQCATSNISEYDPADCEVIGNIYENPELIEGAS